MSILLVILGLIIAGFFLLIYDTTVQTEEGVRVYNEGPMQNRLLGSITGLVVTVVGVVLVVTSPKPPPSA